MQDNYSLIQLPILRLVTFGDPMVVIFFLVSGYSLSIKPLSLIRSGPCAHAQLLTSLSSSFIRRPIRLLLPIFASTLIVLLAAQIGLYSYAASFASKPTKFHQYFKGWAFEATPVIAPTIYLQIVDWCYSMYDLLDFVTHFHWTMTRYDIHLWTIPVELRCSLILFATYIATALMNSTTRLVSLAIFVAAAMTWGDAWEMGLFWIGMGLCELDMMIPAAAHKGGIPKRWIANFTVGLYLMSTPMMFAKHSPFFSDLMRIHIWGLRESDQARFWQCIGATQVLITVSRCQTFKSFFSNRLARYLGRISYALYLVHGPILRSLGYSLAFKLWQITGRATQAQYSTAVVLTAIVVLPAVILAADIFCKKIDEPITRLSRRIESRLRDADLPPEIHITSESRKSDEFKPFRSPTRSPDRLRGLESGLRRGSAF
ncbi:hypothetical protein K461DRAFT_269946 [Myriangium duriaei CBS 260.36]|uniref:Acyltransferase 3 domain-containing protein n=1 Tax=Myriangium duriaei CBS 260.36 TaxID=1168546 RepID=A0A9P4IV40_9PEZI|nr:hypothetical protein K461DRAFT_269946 [Myriangium duriaei CBS 260.36]